MIVTVAKIALAVFDCAREYGGLALARVKAYEVRHVDREKCAQTSLKRLAGRGAGGMEFPRRQGKI